MKSLEHRLQGSSSHTEQRSWSKPQGDFPVCGIIPHSKDKHCEHCVSWFEMLIVQRSSSSLMDLLFSSASEKVPETTSLVDSWWAVGSQQLHEQLR